VGWENGKFGTQHAPLTMHPSFFLSTSTLTKLMLIITHRPTAISR
jgi:hypothetical protein